MDHITTSLHIIFPIINLFLLIIGIKKQGNKWVIAALWLSLGAILIHYQTAGGEILGSYFDYKESFLYSASLLIILVAVVYLLRGFTREHPSRGLRTLISLMLAIMTTGVVLLLANLWINARFIENRMPGSPVLQVGTFQKLDYCHYQYLFYTVNKAGQAAYLCPNYYGLLPSVGTLESVPDYVLRLLPADVQKQVQIKKN
ncbi:type I secretion system protein LssZ [Legionella sp. CNM-4043-24]|uniref:type I secretion system protein LssZ n=1 Tax=Legionella sp. CNM-4043-24 TaxID=3421646 RepID=UPI00403B27AD